MIALSALDQSGLLHCTTNAIHGVALVPTATIIDDCVAVCDPCTQCLQASQVPELTQTTKWFLNPVPPELKGLTLLECLLITQQFHLKHMLKPIRHVHAKTVTYEVGIMTLSGSTSFHQTAILPNSPATLSLVFEIDVWLHPQQEPIQFECLVVRRARMHEALIWLKKTIDITMTPPSTLTLWLTCPTTEFHNAGSPIFLDQRVG
jgi:hypothetical protein